MRYNHLNKANTFKEFICPVGIGKSNRNRPFCLRPKYMSKG